MPKQPPIDRENLEALNSGAGAPPKSHAAANRQPPSAAESDARFRCLYCGYPLMEQSQFRCPECGQEHERYVLERWFWGSEENRINRVLWLVRACLFLKLWVWSDVMPIAAMASAGAAGWACWLAGNDKRDTVGWHYAVAGMAVAGLLIVSQLAMDIGIATWATLDLVAGCLLLVTILRDRDRQRLWREPVGSRTALGIIFVAPVLGLGLSWFVTLVMRGGLTPLYAAMFTGASSGFSFTRTLAMFIPHAIALGVWVFVWRWLEGLKRAMFGRIQGT